MITLNKVVFAVLITSIYTENTNVCGKKKKKRKVKRKKLVEINKPGNAKECASQITHGNYANTNSNPLAQKLATEP